MSNTFLVQKNQVEKKFGPKQCLATKFKVQRNFEISNQNKFWQKKDFKTIDNSYRLPNKSSLVKMGLVSAEIFHIEILF